MKHVALLRGINVGGNHMLPMKDLAAFFEETGCSAIQTFIQSGNVVFQAPAAVVKKIPEAISARIEERFGFPVTIAVRGAKDMVRVAESNPYLKAGALPAALHVTFLPQAPDAAAVAKLEAGRWLPEEFHVLGREIYLHIPDGLGKSKLPAYLAARVAKTGTTRNWNTVMKLVELSAR